MSYPYTIERNVEKACHQCGHGQMWDVIDPSGVALGVSYGCEDDASHMAEELNRAYSAGRASVAAIDEQIATERECERLVGDRFKPQSTPETT